MTTTSPLLLRGQATAKRRSRRARGRRGATLVEFAFVAPVFFLILLASIEFSRLNMMRHTAAHAAYEGARTALVPGATADEVFEHDEFYREASKRFARGVVEQRIARLVLVEQHLEIVGVDLDLVVIVVVVALFLLEGEPLLDRRVLGAKLEVELGPRLRLGRFRFRSADPGLDHL